MIKHYKVKHIQFEGFISLFCFLIINFILDSIPISDFKMINFREGADHCTAETWVKNSLRDLGYDIETSPFWVHAVQNNLLQQSYRFIETYWAKAVKKAVEVVILEEFYKKYAGKV